MFNLKKIVALLLCTVMILSSMSVSAYADLFGNAPEYNQEIMEALRDVAGSENEAKEYYALLEKYGLLDEDGNIVDNLKATIDDVEYTSEELIELLSGDYDGNKVAVIDGTPITLDNLWNIIAIEGYIDYLRESYYNNGGWTEEHEKNYQDFLSQIGSGSLAMTVDTDKLLEGDYSGINHGAAVYFSAAYNGNEATVTANLTSAKEGQEVSFEYEAVSGSANVKSQTGKIKMTADENGDATAEFTVKYQVEDCDDLMANQPVWYVNISKMKNAAVDVGASTVEVVSAGSGCATLKLTAAATVGSDFAIDRIVGNFEKPMGTESGKLTFTSGEKYAINNGLISEVSEIFFDNHIIMIQSLYESISSLLVITYKLAAENGAVLLNNKVTYDVKNTLHDDTYDVEFKRESREGVNGSYSVTHSMEGITVSEGMNYTYSGGYMAPTFKFTDKTTPSFKKIYAPKAKFTTGMSVPIIVEFSEPVSPNGAYLIVNGIRVNAGETKSSNRLSFLYPVQAKDSVYPAVSEIYVKDAAGNAFKTTEPNPDSGEDGAYIVREAEMQSCLPESAITSIKSAISYDDPVNPVLNVTIELSDDAETTAFILSSLDEYNVSDCLKAAIGGSEPAAFKLNSSVAAGGEMVVSFPLKSVVEDKSLTVELYIGDELLFDFLDRVDQTPIKLVNAADISVSTLVKNSSGGAYEYENPENPVIYLQERPIINAFFSLSGSGYAFGDTAKVTVLGSDGTPLDKNADFVWSSSDTSVANINQNGKIIASGEGSVYFTLTALNGNFEGKAVSVNTGKLTFEAGLTPFLTIPGNNIEIESGKPIPVFWSSNIITKDPDASFTLTVTDRAGKTVYTESGIKGCSTIIPENTLEYTYDFTAANVFMITVSAKYDGVPYQAKAKLNLTAAPVLISLDELDTYYYTDSKKSVTINWNISNFIAKDPSDSNNFRLYVTKNSEPVVDSHSAGTGSNGKYTGSYTIEIPDVVTSSDDPTSYRDVYTVSLQIRNSGDSTWSYASCVFYVYDESALKIWVNGEEYGGTLTMTNVPEISRMNQAQILALKRDISLKTVVSANYGEYAWNELSDKIAWSSSDPDVSSINYRQGSYYAPIESYTYTSYRPMTEFMLAGLSDGEAQITAEHVFTGISSALDVKIETLRDKLYLFSVYPAAVTTAYYTNGKGEQKTAVSDSKGCFAIYEESGINGDVYFTSTANGANYYGTYYARSIASGEADPVDLSLYPCNNLVMRRAAYAYVYIKNPDGTPYSGKINFRGGVYLNGQYLENAQFAFAEGIPASKPGNKDNILTLGSDGKLTVVMDNTQWGLEDRELSPYDELSYKFVIEQADQTDYYPLCITIDAKLNEEEYIRSGEAVCTFRANESDGKHPFIFDETLTTINRDVNYTKTMNILGNTACVGVSDLFLEEDLTISVMWWGDSSAKDDNHDMSIVTHKKYDLNPGGKTVSKTVFPFCNTTITTLNVPFDTKIAKAASISKAPTGMELRYADTDTHTAFTEELSFRIADTTGYIFGETEIINLVDGMNESFDCAQTGDHGECTLGDRFMTLALEFLADEDYKPQKDNKGIDMQIMATEDPTVFIGYLSLGLSNMKKTNPTGVYADGSNDSLPLYYPGIREIKWGLSGSANARELYLDEYDKDINEVKAGKKQVDYHYTIAGYLESKIYLNSNGRWKVKVLSGGFDAGGGASLVKYFNTMVGPIPVTAEIRGGLTGEISFDALTMQYLNSADQIDSDAEFLTQFRIFAYFKAFGGIGFDFSAAALKIGLYGQINFSVTFEWLNRRYMGKADGPVRYLDGEEMDTSEVLNGEQIEVSGQVGIEFIAKFLFFSYEKVFYSWDFGGGKAWEFRNWNKIDELWKTSQQYYGSALTTLVNSGSVKMGNPGQLMLNLAPQKDDFSYLQSGAVRTWNAGSLTASQLGAVAGSSVTVIQSNANPFTNPVISDDGSIMVYLSDANGEGDDAVHTAYALNNGGGFTDQGIICGEGAGDSGNSLAGTSDFAVAAWTSLGEAMDKDAGSVLTDDDQMIMLEGSEVYASIYKDGSWTSEKLTDNDSADLAPVAAVSGNRAIVAWRSVATSNLHGDITDFNSKDTILFKTFDGENWSESKTIYNGSSGNVKALNAAMLGDGTAAVIYALDTDADAVTTADREILWATVTPDGEVNRTVQATTDAVSDENPQIAVTSINGEQCFAAAWYSYETDGEDLDHDIHMADFGADGVIRGNLPQSIKQEVRDKSLLISSDFRLTKNSKDITDLSLCWVERVEKKTDTMTVESDVLNSVKFFTYGNNGEIIAATPVQTIAKAPDSTLIDSFDAYSDGNRVVSVMLGTTYDPEKTAEKTGYALDGTEVKYSVAESTSSIYSASGRYTDSVKALEVNGDIAAMHPGTASPVGFSILNDGVNPITSVTVDLGGQKAVKDGLNLLPGDTLIVYVDYVVPSGSLKDENYTVSAVTKEGTFTAKGIAEFGKADIELITPEIIAENEGVRTISFKLSNSSESKLAGSGRTVKVGFYTDPACESPIYGIDTVSITDAETLRMIDEGGYSRQINFDVKEYLRKINGKITEIPEQGIPVYIKASVVENGEECSEISSLNNSGSVLCENLEARTGKAFSTASALSSGENGSVVSVNVKNNSLTGTDTGNVIVTLYDENGGILAQKQSYEKGAEGSGLVTLGGEETESLSFTFEEEGAYAEVMFTDAVLDDDSDASFYEFEVTNIPGVTLSEFTQDESKPGYYSLTTEKTDVESASVIYSTTDPDSVVTLNGETLGGYAQIELEPGKNILDFVVAAPDGTTVNHYILTVITPEEYTLTFESNGGDAVESKTGIREGTAVSLTDIQPERYGYHFGGWFSDEKLENAVASVTMNADTTVYAKWIENSKHNSPENIEKTDETKCSAGDGTISGLTNEMEYSVDGGDYQPCTAEKLTGLKPGTYKIRYAETKDFKSSDPVKIKIEKGDCYGGCATCTEKAVCEGCGEKYGKKDPDNHTFNGYTSDGESHWFECECGYIQDKAAHTDSDKDLICDVCERNLTASAKITDMPAKAGIPYKKSLDLGARSEYGRVIYTSSDPSVAEVDENGIVTAKYKGTCVITAEIKGTGIKEECTVTVGMTLCQLIGNFIARIINNVLIPAAEKIGCACAVRTLRKIADFID